jgi:uncharacterized protein YbbC (DUF1343 family)
VHIIVDSWSRFQPLPTGLTIAATLCRLHPKDWKIDRYDVLLGHRATFEGLRDGGDWRALPKNWQADSQQFVEIRKRYLLYTE